MRAYGVRHAVGEPQVPFQPSLESWQVTLGRTAGMHHRTCGCCPGGLLRAALQRTSAFRLHQPPHVACKSAAVDRTANAPVVKRVHSVKGADTGADTAAPHQQARQDPDKRRVSKHAKTQPLSARHKQQKPLLHSNEAPGKVTIQQVVSKLAFSLQKQDAHTCQRALQELEVVITHTSEIDLLAAYTQDTQHALFKQAMQTAQLQAPRDEDTGAAPIDSTSGSKQAYITHSLEQQTVPDAEQSSAIIIEYLKTVDTQQRANLFLGCIRTKIVKLFLGQQHEAWAQEFILKLPIEIPAACYSSFVTLCIEHNSLKTLSIVLQAQRSAGYVLSHSATRSAMAAYQKGKDSKSVMELFERAVENEMADTDIYCDAMGSCIDSRRYKLAFDIYDRLKRSGLELTLHSYHTALKGSRYLKAAGLQTLYAELMGRHDLILKDKTFGYVFRAAATCGDHLPASWIIQVLSDMHTYMVQMSSHIFTAFLQAISVVPLAAHQVEGVFGAMASYRACQSPSAFVYTSLLTFCARQAPDRALDVWHAMQEDGVEVTSHLLSSMFAACAAAGSQEMLEAADGSHMHMEGLWNKICSKGKTASEEKDMLWAHNALLHVYASHGQVQKAKQLYNSMQERGPAVDVVSASTLIAAYAKAADQTAALQVFDEVLAKGIQPTPQLYTSLLAACSRAGDLAAARRVFRAMHVEPNVAAYTALMDACLKKGTPQALDEAFEVFEEMKAAGNAATATTYGCLLMVCQRQGNVDKAFQLYEEAIDTGVLATDECHNILIGVCSDAGRVEEALDLVKSLASKHGSMRQATLNSLIRSLLNVTQVPRALRMLSIMLNMGLKPYRSTVMALIAGCARDSSSVEAAKFYWGLREQGGEATKAAGSELIISLCKAGDRHEALKVYEDMTHPASFHPKPPLKPPSQTGGRSMRAHRRAGLKHDRKVATTAGAATTAGDPTLVRGNSSDRVTSGGSRGGDQLPSLLNADQRTANSGGQGHQPSTSHLSLPAQDMFAATADSLATSSQLSGAAVTNEAAVNAQTHTQPSEPVIGTAVTEPQQNPPTPSPSKQHGASPDANMLLSRPSRRAEPEISAIAQDPAHNQGSAGTATDDALHPHNAAGHNQYHAHSTSQTANLGHSLSHSNKQKEASARPGGSNQQAGTGERLLAPPTAAAAASHGKLVSSLKLSQRAVFPSIGATAALVHAFAMADDIHQCDRLYQQLQRDKKGLPGLTQSNRRMWESTIEAACRAGRTEWALQVFDDWKASSMSAMFVQPSEQAQPVKLPTLSNATLAFLESCCRGSAEHEWRVYDVCAVMRQQRERKQEAALARPAKKSHHVADADS